MQYAHLFQPDENYKQMPERTLLDKRQTFVRYHNDNNEVEGGFNRQVLVAGGPVSNFVVDDKEQKSQALEDAIFWPKSSMKTKAVGPWVLAAGVGFFAVPAFWPAMGAGETIAIAYATGALSYYLIHNRDIQVKKN